jgi:hypothetical protein
VSRILPDNHDANDKAERIRERLLSRIREAIGLRIYALWGSGVFRGIPSATSKALKQFRSFTSHVGCCRLRGMKLSSLLLALLLCTAALHAAEPIIIADFESDTYGAWKVEGDAFGKGPAQGTLPGQMKVSGFLGKGLANSFNGGDKATGTLTSPAFKIERKFITFLIGGGGYEKETCMNLVVDGKIVRTMTGPNTKPGGSEELAPASWDVAELMGREAVIAIIDERKGGWGHINVDHIMQSDTAAAPRPATASKLLTAPKPVSAPWNKPIVPGEVVLFEDGKDGPLQEGLEFHHGSWKFGDGAMIGEQVPTEKHLATIKGLVPFDRLKIEWKMKFVQPKQNFLFVTWPADSGAHAMDFTYTPDDGQFAIARPKWNDKPSAVLIKGKVDHPESEWHSIVCIHDGPSFTVTIDGTTLTASDEAFARPMGPFYLNGGGFNGAQFMVKDLKVTALK